MDIELKNIEQIAKTLFTPYSTLDTNIKQKVDAGLETFTNNYNLNLSEDKKTSIKDKVAPLLLITNLAKDEDIRFQRSPSPVTEILYKIINRVGIEGKENDYNTNLIVNNVAIDVNSNHIFDFKEFNIQLNNNGLKDITFKGLFNVYNALGEKPLRYTANTDYIKLNWKPTYDGEEPNRIGFEFSAKIINGKQSLSRVMTDGDERTFQEQHGTLENITILQEEALKKEIREASKTIRKYCERFGSNFVIPKARYKLNNVITEEVQKLGEELLSNPKIISIKADGIVIENESIKISNINGYDSFKKIMPLINYEK